MALFKLYLRLQPEIDLQWNVNMKEIIAGYCEAKHYCIYSFLYIIITCW
jgi:hypothetical protein